MTAFLFIPARDDATAKRRVDFTNIASVFGDADELPVRSNRHLLHAVLALLVLLVAMGDMLLVARPEMLASLTETGQATVHALSSGSLV